MVSAMGLLCLAGCQAAQDSEHARLATVQNGPVAAPAGQAAPGAAAPSSDVQTLQDNARRDQQTLNAANKAVGVLGR